MNSGNENIPYKELLYVSFKVGITGGVIGGVGTWLMNHFLLNVENNHNMYELLWRIT